jgi:hypothetical protein
MLFLHLLDRSMGLLECGSDLNMYLDGSKVRERSYQQRRYVKQMLSPVRWQSLDAAISMVQQSAGGGISGFRLSYMEHGLEK